jgi:hypothetical protein
MKRLTDEICTSFTSDSQITFSTAAKLPYLSAVIEESLRIYPPFCTSMARLAPAGGDTVAGHWIPENLSIEILNPNENGLTLLSRLKFTVITTRLIMHRPILPCLMSLSPNAG